SRSRKRRRFFQSQAAKDRDSQDIDVQELLHWRLASGLHTIKPDDHFVFVTLNSSFLDNGGRAFLSETHPHFRVLALRLLKPQNTDAAPRSVAAHNPSSAPRPASAPPRGGVR